MPPPPAYSSEPYSADPLAIARAQREDVERRLAALNKIKMNHPTRMHQAPVTVEQVTEASTLYKTPASHVTVTPLTSPEISKKTPTTPKSEFLSTPRVEEIHARAGARPAVTVCKASAQESSASAASVTAIAAPAPATPATLERRTPEQDRKAAMKEDWLSIMIEHMWPFIHDVTQEQAWELVPEALEQNRPPWVHSMRLTKFTLGCKEPDLTNVRCYSDDDDIVDDVFMEMDLEWRSQLDVRIEVEVLGKDVSDIIPNFLEAQLAKLMSMTVVVEDCVVKGTVQVAMRPLMRRLPIIGAMQIAFTGLPDFEFSPSVAGGPLGDALNALLPMMKAWLKTTVQEAIFMPYVLPEHYFYPIDEHAPDINPPIGILHCTVLEARNVPKMDMFGWSDTFVEVYVSHPRRHNTGIKTGKTPHWNEQFSMPIHSEHHQRLRFALWDYDAMGPDDEIGRCDIGISELMQGQEKDLWLDVRSGGEEGDAEKERREQREGLQANGEKGETGGGLGKGGRLLGKMLSGGTQTGKKKCQLRVRVSWRKWTREEAQFVKQAVRHGVNRAFQTPEGERIDPELKELLRSGDLQVTVKRCEKLCVQGLLRRPSVKAVVRVADEEPCETEPFKVSRRGNADLSGAPVEIHVDGDIAKDGARGVDIVIQLQEVGFLSGNDIVGELRMPLGKLMEKGCITGDFPLEKPGRKSGAANGTQENGRCAEESRKTGGKGSAGWAEMELRWIGMFG